MAATRETHTTRTHETTRRSYTNDEASAFLEASTLSNRAMTARRLFRFADALDDATRARSRCETYDAFSERPSVRFELLSIKIACAQADALVNLPGRAWEACGVLRETLRRLARAGAERTTANERTVEAEATINRRSAFRVFAREARTRLRAALERVPMGVLCDHWAFAIESAADQRRGGPSPLSARQTGRLMRPAAVGRERRATTAESSRRLRDALAGAEPRWRAFTAEAWIRACAASAAVSAPNHADARPGPGPGPGPVSVRRRRVRAVRAARARARWCTEARATSRSSRATRGRARRTRPRCVRRSASRSAHASGARTGRFRVGVPRFTRRFTRRERERAPRRRGARASRRGVRGGERRGGEERSVVRVAGSRRRDEALSARRRERRR